jgi:hypothetical protein
VELDGCVRDAVSRRHAVSYRVVDGFCMRSMLAVVPTHCCPQSGPFVVVSCLVSFRVVSLGVVQLEAEWTGVQHAYVNDSRRPIPPTVEVRKGEDAA